MRLRVRGVFLLVIILVVACAFTGVMIWKWRYEDSKAQADVNQLVQMDAGTTSLAIQALPEK